MSRRDERERIRQERLAAEQAAARSAQRRLYIGYAVAGLLSAAIVAAVVLAITGGGGGGGNTGDYCAEAHIQDDLGSVPDEMEPDCREGTAPPAVATADLEQAAEIAECDLQLDLGEEGSTHFLDEDKDPGYQTNPPTTGDHYGNPAETASGALADGAYLNYPPITRAVHSMEHGRVEIHYSPDLSEKDQLAIKGVFDESPPGVLMFPDPEMPYAVALTAWTIDGGGQLAGCDSYRGAATLDLIRAFRDVYRNQGPEPVPLTA